MKTKMLKPKKKIFTNIRKHSIQPVTYTLINTHLPTNIHKHLNTYTHTYQLRKYTPVWNENKKKTTTIEWFTLSMQIKNGWQQFKKKKNNNDEINKFDEFSTCIYMYTDRSVCVCVKNWKKNKTVNIYLRSESKWCITRITKIQSNGNRIWWRPCVELF